MVMIGPDLDLNFLCHRENDLEEIAKETGIELDQNGEDVEEFANLNKKDKKKKKGGKAAAVERWVRYLGFIR